jgi:hypothetical protein
MCSHFAAGQKEDAVSLVLLRRMNKLLRRMKKLLILEAAAPFTLLRRRTQLISHCC